MGHVTPAGTLRHTKCGRTSIQRPLTLRNRGVEDVLLAVVDGLKGFPDAIRAVFPEALVQTCIVHLLRHSLDFVSYKDRKLVAGALKNIYRALDAAAGEAALAAFESSEWGRRYPARDCQEFRVRAAG